MPLTIKNYAKQLTKDLLQQAEKNTVRECDETSKGNFIAYVDEGNSSYDVSLVLLRGGEVGESSCDCKANAAFCRHRAALLIHIANDQKVKAPVKLKKKEAQTGSLLDQVDLHELKNWVQGLMANNKDIELAFVHHFSAKKQAYTPAEVEKLIKDAIKAAGCNKKNVDASEVKKLVDLWAQVLQPVVQYYHDNVMNSEAFKSFHTLMEQCIAFDLGIKINSNRIVKFLDGVLQKAEAPVNDLHNDAGWYKAARYFIDEILKDKYELRIHYLLHVRRLMDVTTAERKERTIELLAAQYNISDAERRHNCVTYTAVILDIIEKSGLFARYHQIFKPLYFQNDLNLKLIGMLIAIEQFSTAEKFCRAQIANNQREEYSTPYLSLLKKIYTIQKDETKLAGVLEILFPLSFDLADYLFISERMQPELQKKWRNKMFTKARSLSRNGDKEALMFCFDLLAYEKSFKKMTDLIDPDTPYDVILKYFYPMAAADKARLLEAIVIKRDNWRSGQDAGANEEVYLKELLDKAQKTYPADYFKLVIDQATKKAPYTYSAINRFVLYAKKQLDMRN